MEEVFVGLECRLQVSGMVADLFMMEILSTAMEEAYGRIWSKEGDIGRLNDRARFCELAIVQLEWCLRFLQEEMDIYIAESGREREKLFGDLVATRDLMQKRMEEIEFAVSEKDQELTERAEIELKLRRDLELKEEELRSLHALLEHERARNGVEWSVGSESTWGIEARECTFDNVKIDIQKQIMSVTDKIEEVKDNLLDGLESGQSAGGKEVSCIPVDIDAKEQVQTNCADKIVNHSSVNFCLRDSMNKSFEQMGKEIDVLEEKVDHSFEMMDRAIYSSKVVLEEYQWRSELEREVMDILAGNFLKDVKRNSNAESLHGMELSSLASLYANWFSFLKDITDLVDELKLLATQIDLQLENAGGDSDSIGTGRNYISQKKTWLGVKPILENMRCGKDSRNNDGMNVVDVHKHVDASSKSKDLLDSSNSSKEKSLGHANHFVAELIRNHETIIRGKIEESTWARGEMSRDKRRLSIGDDDDGLHLLKVISGVISKLEIIIKENDGQFIDLGGSRRAPGKDGVSASDILAGEDLEIVQMPEIVPEKLCPTIACYSAAVNSSDDPRHLKLEKGDPNSKETKLEDANSVPPREFASKVDHECMDYGMEIQIRKDICKIMFTEMVKQWKDDRQALEIEKLVREEVDRIVLGQIFKDIECYINSKGFSCKLHLGSMDHGIDTCIHWVVFSEMVRQWRHDRETYGIEKHIREDLERIILSQMIKDIRCVINVTTKSQEENRLSFDYVMQEVDTPPTVITEAEDDLPANLDLESTDSCMRTNLIDWDLEYFGGDSLQHAQISKWDDDSFDEVKSKLEKALQQIILCKMQLTELGSSLGISLDDKIAAQDQITSLTSITEDEEQYSTLPTKNEEFYWKELQSLLMPLKIFCQDIINFGIFVCEKIGINVSRLDGLRNQFGRLADQAKSLKKKKLLYQKAFTRRCYDLQMAEAEVDLLGDEVDALLGLLEKSYTALERYSPIFQHHSGMMDILRLMGKELRREAPLTSFE